MPGFDFGQTRWAPDSSPAPLGLAFATSLLIPGLAPDTTLDLALLFGEQKKGFTLKEVEKLDFEGDLGKGVGEVSSHRRHTQEAGGSLRGHLQGLEWEAGKWGVKGRPPARLFLIPKTPSWKTSPHAGLQAGG